MNLAQRFNPRMITGLVLLVIALILVGVSGALPWYVASSSSDLGQSVTEYSLSQVCLATATEVQCVSHAVASEGSVQGRAFFGLFAVTGGLVTAGLLLALLALVLLVLSAFWPRVGRGVLPSGLIGSFLVLGAPIYLFVALPITVNSFGGAQTPGFFGTIPGEFVTTTVGGGAGWFLAFVAFVFLLVATILALRAVRTVAPLGSIRLGGPTYAPAYAPPQPPAGAPPAQQPYPPPSQQPYPPPSQQPYPPPAQPPTQQPVEPSEKVTPEETQVCPECGTPAPAGQAFCSKCGTKLTQE